MLIFGAPVLSIYTTILPKSPKLAIAQLASATTTQPVLMSSMLIQAICGGVAASLFDLPDQYGRNHPDHDGYCPIAAEILIGCKQTRALTEPLNPFDQFESSAAHSAAIMVFILTALSSTWAGNASLHREDSVVK